MSFYNKASLLTIPTAYKQGKLYSVKPDDGSGDFTFTRSTSATRVNSDGLIEKARENLLLQSNDFNQWLKLNVTVTSSQNGYDGSNNAWLLTDTSVSASHRVYIANSHSGVYTFSVYAKAGTKSIVYIQSYINNNSITYFDLAAGSVLSTINNIHSKIEAVGNGWYRCSMSFNNTNAYVTIGMADSATANYLGDGTGTLLIQDAQLEQGLVATDYIETTTSTVATGIVENIPRIDYSSGTPSLLLEPQRTNLFYYSEYSEYAGINVTREYVESPDGFTNALRVYETAANGQHFTPYRGSVVAGQTYSLSFFIKKGSYDEVKVYTQSVYISSIFTITFSTNNLTFTGSDIVPNSQKMENYGNGWYRVSGTVIPNNSGNFFIYAVVKDLTTYVGDPTKYTDYYGFQAEEGSYATSYIPTYGTSVTRTFDYTLLDDLISLGLVTATELTFFIDLNAESLIRDSSAADIIFGNISSNGIFIYNNGLNSMNGIIYLRDGSTTEAETLTQSPSKICIKVKPNDVKVFINGLNVATYTSLNFDFTSNSNLVLQSKNRTQIVNKLLFFPTALTDAECITLTTI